MGDSAFVKKLIELLSKYSIEKLCGKKDFTYPITKDFFKNFRNVLYKMQWVTIQRWRVPFAISHSQMHSTPEMYLRYTFYACRQESLIHLNIFERFLSVAILILNLRVVDLWKPSVDFQKLMPKIFMAFYESELKKPFERCGGFRRLVEYINDPKYLASHGLLGNDSSKASGGETHKQKQRKLNEENKLPSGIRIEDAEIDRVSITLSQKIFKDRNFKPCLVQGYSDPLVELYEYTNQKLSQLDKFKKHVEEQLKDLGNEHQLLLSLSSDSDNNAIARRIIEASKHEKLIQKVIKYNRLNNSDQASENNFRQKEVFDILDNLEIKIKYLLEFLDEYGTD